MLVVSEHLNRHRRLLVLVCRESLRLLGGDHSVAGDELRHDAADGLDTARQRVDIQEQDVLDVVTAIATQDATLQACTAFFRSGTKLLLQLHGTCTISYRQAGCA